MYIIIAENVKTYCDIESYFLELQVKVNKNSRILGIAVDVSGKIFSDFLSSSDSVISKDFSWKRRNNN